MKRIPLILSPALLLLLPAIALYPMLHASAEKDGVESRPVGSRPVRQRRRCPRRSRRRQWFYRNR